MKNSRETGTRLFSGWPTFWVNVTEERSRKNEDIFQRVLEKTTVSFMKDIMKTNPKEIQNVIKKSSSELQPSPAFSNQKSSGETDINILRKGIVGDWKQHFTPENIEKMQGAINERTMGSDIMDLWKCH
ncbi:unnamed protein product [Ixodes hexagonus]